MNDELTAYDRSRIVRKLTESAKEEDDWVTGHDDAYGQYQTRQNARKNREIARKVLRGD